MNRKIKLFIIGCLFANLAFAGGSSFQMKIISFKKTEKDEYKMQIAQISDSSVFGKSSNTNRTIYLRYAPEKLGGKLPNITKENYLAAIKQLEKDLIKGKPIYFGTIGTGLKKIPLKKNSWQSNAISIIEEHDGKKVVYSYANPI